MRRPEIDILRGLAVLLVLGRHLFVLPESLPEIVRLPLEVWREIGWIGVDLFFVLSGFLVSGLLFSEHSATGQMRIGRFLIRRGFKIYPSFYFFLAISYLTAHYWALPSRPVFRSFLAETLFVQNYTASVWNHTWSLAVEEHFYLLLAGLFYLRMRGATLVSKSFTFIPLLTAGISILLLVLRTRVSLMQPSGDWMSTLMFTHFRVDSLFFGVLISYLFHYEREKLTFWVNRFILPIVAFVLLATFLPAFYPLESSRVMYSVGFSILFLAFGGLLALSLLTPLSDFLKRLDQYGLIEAIGRNSYSVYLWHMMAYVFSARVFDPEASLFTFFVHITVYLVGSIVVGITVANLIEFPALRLRDRFWPSPRRNVVI